MNSLKFIEKEIHFISVVKKENEKMLNDERPEHTKEYIKTLIKEYEEKLNNLQQIKTELEALKIIKDTLVLNVETATAKALSLDGNVISLKGYWLVQGDIQKKYTIYPSEYEILKKALEVNE